MNKKGFRKWRHVHEAIKRAEDLKKDLECYRRQSKKMAEFAEKKNRHHKKEKSEEEMKGWDYLLGNLDQIIERLKRKNISIQAIMENQQNERLKRFK